MHVLLPLSERFLAVGISQKCPPLEMNICSRPLWATRLFIKNPVEMGGEKELA